MTELGWSSAAGVRLAALCAGLGLSLLAGCATSAPGADMMAAAPPTAPGATFVECKGCPEMTVVPAGSFVMGSPEDEPHRMPDEGQHRVTFAQPFAVSKYDVTWDQWMDCVRDGGCPGNEIETALRLNIDGTPNTDYRDMGRGTRPVVGVSWYDAQGFVGWLNAKAGTDAYRMLSEAEWEYAARAGSTTIYPWGDDADHDRANYGFDEGDALGGKAEGRDIWVDDTAPVGSFPPNAWGLYDMPGNIYEWVEDCYQADPSLLPTDGAPVHDGDCNARVMRSVSFVSHPENMRVANRVGLYPPNRRGRNYLGFRVARTLE